MSERAETLLLVAFAAGLGAAYLACGCFLASLTHLAEGGIGWWLFAMTWPVPIGAVMLMMIVVLSIALACAKALVR